MRNKTYMIKSEIKKCGDIEKLRKICLEQWSQLFVVSEILVDESKMHITPEEAVEKIRDYLTTHQYDLEEIIRCR